MIEKIISGIVKQIRQSYSEEKYEIYADLVEQGLNEPCFSILCLNPSFKHKIGQRFQSTMPFIIRYWPQNAHNRNEVMEVLEELQYLLKDIEVDGFKVHAEEMTSQIVDGVLQFQVEFKIFVMTQTEDKDKFESYEIRTGVGG